MKRLDRRDAIKVMAVTASLTAASSSGAEAAEPENHAKGTVDSMNIQIPASLKAEHDELHEELVQATKAGGKTGQAAQAVAKVLHPHFVKEEELAMPPLGLLAALAAGRVEPEMANIVKLTDQLKKELPAMLKEHEAIVVALDMLAEAAREENRTQAGHFAKKLAQHAKTEEEVLYPTAILVGEYVKLRLNK